mmetsp:Transcript_22355/g.48857  ORF Transcript_22355/g.48857 Transcript_22355/m.48857 type:complete len:97 (-) Transcript_22355:1027-1317(-)
MLNAPLTQDPGFSNVLAAKPALTTPAHPTQLLKPKPHTNHGIFHTWHPCSEACASTSHTPHKSCHLLISMAIKQLHGHVGLLASATRSKITTHTRS